MSKTNAARLLDKHGVKYELVEYKVDEEDLSAINVAAKLGQNIKQVFKTLVVKGAGNACFVCVVPGDVEIDLKKAAKAAGAKSAELIPVKDIMKITGYIRGGCSPLAMKKEYPVFIHNSCLDFEHICISAGIRGMQIKLNPKDLIAVSSAKVCEIV